MSNPISITIPFRLELLAMFTQLERGLQMSREDIIKFALFLYHPEVLKESNLDCVPVLVFLNKVEVFWLRAIANWTKLSEENVLMKIFHLGEEEKTIYEL